MSFIDAEVPKTFKGSLLRKEIKKIKPNVDFENEDALVDDGILNR